MNEVERSASKAQPVLASAKVRTTASSLGFTDPPVPLRLKLLEGPYHWSLFVQAPPGARIGDIVEWLEEWSPLRIEFGSRHVLRVDLDPLPLAWRRRFRSVSLQMLALYPNGVALATVTGKHDALAAFGRAQAGEASTNVQEVRDTPRDVPLLTPAQDEALRTAARSGYYRIPRPLNLNELAAKLGIAPASLSERLRRAEGRVIMRYVNEGATTPWDARTIFAAQTSPGPGTEDEDSSGASRVRP